VVVLGNTKNVTTHGIPSTDARFARLRIDAIQPATTTVARTYEFEVFGTGL